MNPVGYFPICFQVFTADNDCGVNDREQFQWVNFFPSTIWYLLCNWVSLTTRRGVMEHQLGNSIFVSILQVNKIRKWYLNVYVKNQALNTSNNFLGLSLPIFPISNTFKINIKPNLRSFKILNCLPAGLKISAWIFGNPTLENHEKAKPPQSLSVSKCRSFNCEARRPYR